MLSLIVDMHKSIAKWVEPFLHNFIWFLEQYLDKEMLQRLMLLYNGSWGFASKYVSVSWYHFMSLKQSLICSKSNTLQMVGNDFVCADQIPWMPLILNSQHLSYFGIQFPTTVFSFTVSVCHFRGRGSVIWLPLSSFFLAQKSCTWKFVLSFLFFQALSYLCMDQF